MNEFSIVIVSAVYLIDVCVLYIRVVYVQICVQHVVQYTYLCLLVQYV